MYFDIHKGQNMFKNSEVSHIIMEKRAKYQRPARIGALPFASNFGAHQAPAKWPQQ